MPTKGTLFLSIVFGILLAVTNQPLFGKTIPAPEEFAGVRQYIHEAIQEGLTPSVAVAVVRDGRVVWAEGFGYADLERKRPATPESIYRLASISKPMTATGLMILVDRGLIDLDDPANNYLKGTKLRSYFGPDKQITIRRLANHTSGLPIHYNFYYDRSQIPSFAKTVERYGFTATPPGERWEYSNLAFGILDHITAEVAKRPWHEFMAEEVYRPLGMRNTAAGPPADGDENVVVQYGRDVAGRFFPIAWYEFDHPGASTIRSSAWDMARFAQMHLNLGELDGTRILSEQAAREMQRKTSFREDGAGTGVGWACDMYRGRRSIWHTGGMPGVATYLRLYPDDNCATVVLTNTDVPTVRTEVTRRLAEVLFPHAPAEAPDPTEEPKTEIEKWKGTWKGTMAHIDGEIPLVVEFRSEDDVRVHVGQSPEWQMTDVAFQADGQFRGRVNVRLRTQRGFHGNPDLEFRLDHRGERLTGAAVAFASGYFALSHWVTLEREAP